MKKIWVHRATSFQKASQFDQTYYRAMSPRERLETMQFLRESFLEFHKQGRHGKTGKGLQRVITIIQQA